MIIEIPWQVRKRGPMAMTIYSGVIERDGPQAEKFAEMLALQQPPGVKGTNDQFMRGKMCGEQFDMDNPMQRMVLERYRAKAKAAGVSIEGKYYYADVADEEGDPKAWFASRDDLAAYVRSRGWSCEQLGIRGPEVEVEDSPYCVSDEIVQEEIEKIRLEHPEAGATPREYADLQDELRRKLSGSLYGK